MSNSSQKSVDFPDVVELNVGGVFYTTSLTTLTKNKESLLGQIFTGESAITLVRDIKGKYFLDRDGVLFRYVLDYIRNDKIILPENFHEKDRLRNEAEHFNLPDMVKSITASSLGGGRLSPLAHRRSVGHSVQSNAVNSSITAEGKTCGFITLGYRGTFAFGRDGLADVKFRKLSRIIICGRVSLCREVFKDTLNESRDPDRGCSDRYTSRFFLKHSFLEQALDMLLEEGFRLVGACGSGTNNAGEVKPGMDTEEAKWQHYNEFVFERR
ncbi:BTB/POZ domain-containing protein KCTD12-like [Mya arenaria]|uniref:BTB/POZ domain-containing protein KCTD12-like n=1 Tax=Mya arenaria TaxID=6604 RepID=UPI0022E5F9A3|nr:BTB/POZ domain-containing protein KCTD12-like [Mya arenaria]